MLFITNAFDTLESTSWKKFTLSRGISLNSILSSGSPCTNPSTPSIASPIILNNSQPASIGINLSTQNTIPAKPSIKLPTVGPWSVLVSWSDEPITSSESIPPKPCSSTISSIAC